MPGTAQESPQGLPLGPARILGEGTKDRGSSLRKANLRGIILSITQLILGPGTSLGQCLS